MISLSDYKKEHELKNAEYFSKVASWILDFVFLRRNVKQ